MTSVPVATSFRRARSRLTSNTVPMATRSTFPVLYPVLAPERPPDGEPAPASKT